MRKPLVARIVMVICVLASLPGWRSGGGSAASIPAAREPGHLYLNVYDSSTKRNVILRYVLQDGLPAASPDLVINDFGYLAGVAPDGQVYSGEGRETFFAFRPGATKPYRRFHIQLPRYEDVVASAVDARGDFWVEYWEPSDEHLAGSTGGDGAAAFPPDARGDVSPIRRLAKGGSFGLAFNSRDDMFVDGFHPAAPLSLGLAILDIATPVEHPRLIRAYRDSDINDPHAAIAVNAGDDLFVRIALTNVNTGIAVFANGADPHGPPTNVIETSFTHLYGLAADSRYVFAIDGDAGANVLDIYLANGNGPQQPIVSSPISGGIGSGVVTGP